LFPPCHRLLLTTDDLWLHSLGSCLSHRPTSPRDAFSRTTRIALCDLLPLSRSLPLPSASVAFSFLQSTHFFLAASQRVPIFCPRPRLLLATDVLSLGSLDPPPLPRSTSPRHLLSRRIVVTIPAPVPTASSAGCRSLPCCGEGHLSRRRVSTWSPHSGASLAEQHVLLCSSLLESRPSCRCTSPANSSPGVDIAPRRTRFALPLADRPEVWTHKGF